MSEEELLKKIQEICEPYKLTVKLYISREQIYNAELSGNFPGYDILSKVSSEISKIREIDRVLWLVAEK